MARCRSFRFALQFLGAVLWLFLSLDARCQSPDFILSKLDEGHLDSLASHAAQKIREANLDEKEPKVLVIDFFRGSAGNSSRLGTLLADRFSESLIAYSSGLRILDRRILKDYLIKEWTTLEDLQSSEVCLRIGRQLGAAGVILGTLYEENGQISLTVHVAGFGRVKKEADVFQATDEKGRFSLTEDMHAMLIQPGPNYARTADEIPEEPGIARSGSPGVTLPSCTQCQPPDYSDAARTAKFQGTVNLSILVTAQGDVTSIYVLKGAPFGLTAKAIEATHNWRFKPGQKDGKPIPVRVVAESTFRFF